MTSQRAMSLETEVVKLFQLVEKLKGDLATVHDNDRDGLVLESAADQVAAITQESEAATNTVMDATEEIAAIAAKLKSEIKYAGAQPIFQDILDNSQSIIEACQSHDIIQQRLSRIVRTINLVEGTLNSMVVTVGKDGIADVQTAISGIHLMDGDIELAGPCLAGEGLTQPEVDAILETKDAEAHEEIPPEEQRPTRPYAFG